MTGAHQDSARQSGRDSRTNSDELQGGRRQTLSERLANGGWLLYLLELLALAVIFGWMFLTTHLAGS